MTNIFSPFYKKIKKNFYNRSPRLYFLADKYKTLIKFGFSGLLATTVHFSVLYILTDLAGVWYIISTSIAFISAFFVSFFAQKFWTFRENTTHKITRQMGAYMGVGVMNLFLNGIGMYLAVDIWGIMYLFAQVLVGVVVATETFLVYRYIIFEKNRKWV